MSSCSELVTSEQEYNDRVQYTPALQSQSPLISDNKLEKWRNEAKNKAENQEKKFKEILDKQAKNPFCNIMDNFSYDYEYLQYCKWKQTVGN